MAEDRYGIVYVCDNGHERSGIPLSRIRQLKRCGGCVPRKEHNGEDVKRRCPTGHEYEVPLKWMADIRNHGIFGCPDLAHPNRNGMELSL